MAHEQDVVGLLLEQHDQIKSLFGQIAAARGEQKRRPFEELVRLLAVHEAAEEEVVHPIARRNIDDGDDIVEARLAEEEQAKRELAELYDLGVNHRDFDGRMEAFAKQVVAHATNEEKEEFVRLRETFKPAELRSMVGAVKAAEAVAPTRPHPMTGESATANLLAGPPLALFDRVRDSVRDWAAKRG